MTTYTIELTAAEDAALSYAACEAVKLKYPKANNE